MGKRNEPLKVERYLSVTGRDGPFKPWDECTQEEIDFFLRRTAEKIGNKLSEWYSAHPKEWAALLLKEGELTQEQYDSIIESI